MQLDECHEIKNQLLHFMKDRTSFLNKDDLKISYAEFKRRNGGALPDFALFFDALKRFKMINTRGDKIDFIFPVLWESEGYRVWLQQYPMNKRRLGSLIFGTNESRDRKLMESNLTWKNYTRKFQLLLHLEEFQMVNDNKRYNITNITNKERGPATMKKDRGLIVLELPGLSESHPFLQPGDELFVYLEGEKYRGSVVSVQQQSVKLHFAPQLLLRFREDMKFRVEFIVNRRLLRIQHRAVVQASQYGLWKLLFPDTRPSSRPRPKLPNLWLFDKRLGKNPEQYRAVQHIVAGSSMPAPHLVFGPPGTGKTVTLVEAIKQIEKTQDGCHILACAPTNSSADLLCRNIQKSGMKRYVFRFYAISVKPNDVPENLKDCSNLDGGSFYLPKAKDLMEYRIIVTTLCTAARLVTLRIPKEHFTHVFVDDAGQALESECLIPLAGLVSQGYGQVVLAGDPKQLGPIVKSATARRYGLNISLLERLLIAFSEDESVAGVFDDRFVTKLLRNFRSHPDILKVPSDLFYGGRLKPHANDSRNDFCDWPHLPKKGFPVIFCGVRGHKEREESSPSFFNTAEVKIVNDYVGKLLQTKDKNGLAILPKDIGIIAPYSKQVKEIQKALEILGAELKRGDMKDLKIGVVEAFQGDERRIILVSTVRSNAEHLQNDEKGHMGLVTNEKRINVALTRAKALLIVVGNPSTLATNYNWKTFINFCREKEGYFHLED